ncbi:hypothetical protein V8J36_06605 [Frigidibacter sp. MR17.14]|uniref:hypothetical protein n=1 Tax=Frigidibacter sp. MR17.14 TaxID=3126509 RepID=UPI003012BB8C
MQRLLILAALLGAVVLALRWLAARVMPARDGDPLPVKAGQDGTAARLAFAALFLVIAATSAGWLEGL